jgi:hypothetical protein
MQGLANVKSVFVLVIGLLSLAGCGGKVADGPVTAPVSGTVTLGGKPLAGASVTFMSDKFIGFGKTNAEGKYELVQGAVPGKNKVTISKLDESNLKLDPENGIDLEQARAAAAGAPTNAAPKDEVAPDYSDPTRSKLTFEVPAGGSKTADFRL